MSDEIKELKADEKEKLDVAAENPPVVPSETNVTENRDNYSWMGGVVLIAIGVIFLLSNVANFQLNNWWALFILIPALVSFGRAYSIYRETGHMDSSARGSIFGGLIMLLIASAFLFDLDWGLIWPVFLILGGLAALAGGLFR